MAEASIHRGAARRRGRKGAVRRAVEQARNPGANRPGRMVVDGVSRSRCRAAGEPGQDATIPGHTGRGAPIVRTSASKPGKRD
ncbi:hypothetical protein LC55x_1997 [Lysobacter capsici]|nr:hypothetical protein LC55x_1997 [Lysobacter capsici]